jgi:hypothetical protein
MRGKRRALVFFQLLTEETMNDEAKKKKEKKVNNAKTPRSYLPLAHNSPNSGVPSVLAFHPSSPVFFSFLPVLCLGLAAAVPQIANLFGWHTRAYCHSKCIR